MSGSLSSKKKIIYITSSSKLKIKAISNVYATTRNSNENLDDVIIIPIIQSTFELPEQPINEYGIMSAKMRIDGCRAENLIGDDYIAIISIESYIDENLGKEFVVSIGEYPDGTIIVANVKCESFHPALYSDYKNNHTTAVFGGYSSTFGSYMNANGHCDNPKDWFKLKPRVEYITEALMNADNVGLDANTIYGYLDYFKDYPKDGVIFSSLSSLMSNQYNFKEFRRYLLKFCNNVIVEIDYIIGLETRGIHIGMLMAHFFNCGFQMARKAGKLPYKNLLSTKYSTEYSKDSIELAPLKGLSTAKNILIVDDLIATGGSICAVSTCIRAFVKDSVNIYCYAPLKVPSLENSARELIETKNKIIWL